MGRLENRRRPLGPGRIPSDNWCGAGLTFIDTFGEKRGYWVGKKSLHPLLGGLFGDLEGEKGYVEKGEGKGASLAVLHARASKDRLLVCPDLGSRRTGYT